MQKKEYRLNEAIVSANWEKNIQDFAHYLLFLRGLWTQKLGRKKIFFNLKMLLNCHYFGPLYVFIFISLASSNKPSFFVNFIGHFLFFEHLCWTPPTKTTCLKYYLCMLTHPKSVFVFFYILTWIKERSRIDLLVQQ